MRGIAVWGLGPHALKNIIPAITDSRSVRLVGVCSRSDVKRLEASASWRCASWASPEEMLEDSRVDAVYVATPTGMHFAHGMQVLGAGKHLLCEKSLTAAPADALVLVECAREKRLVLHEGFAFLHHPRLLAVRESVSASGFGAVLHAFCCFGLPPLEAPGFRNDPQLGGGALLDVGCYPIAAMLALFGGDVSVLHARIVSSASALIDTHGDANLLFGGNVRADISWGYNRSYAADLLVHGERQSLVANRLFSKLTFPDSRVILRDLAGVPGDLALPPFNGFHGLFDAFVRAMEDDRSRLQLLDDALRRAGVMEAVMRSAR